MHARDIMSNAPVTIRADATVGHALRALAQHGITMLPVVDGAHRVIGVVSEADLILGRVQPDPLVAAGAPPARPQAPRNRTRPSDLVEDVMSRPPVSVHPDTDLVEVERVFARTGLKSLPVLEAEQVVGVVSRSDLVRALTRDDETLQQDITDTLTAAGLRGYRVVVRNGVVQLTGTGPAPGTGVVDVIDLVAATPGVTAVHTS